MIYATIPIAEARRRVDELLEEILKVNPDEIRSLTGKRDMAKEAVDAERMVRRENSHWPTSEVRVGGTTGTLPAYEPAQLSLDQLMTDADRNLSIVFGELRGLLTRCHELGEYKKAQNILYALININNAFESLWEE